jgi:histidinol-phosphate/aromatic aminotransferase/cobyric acid decarboxylase-like protein
MPGPLQHVAGVPAEKDGLLRRVSRLVHGAIDPAALRAEGVDPAAPTTAGFFLVHAGDAAALRRALLERGCLVRDCSSFGLPADVRVSPRQPSENDRLLAAFGALRPPEEAR